MREQVVALHPLKDGVLEFFPTPGIAEIPWIMLIWGAIYAAGQVILGSLERGAIGFLVTVPVVGSRGSFLSRRPIVRTC
ncbi:MAG: hypothetical protein VYC64_05295 [Candidatus Latescibacterota bacterium]|nr:hypothetical protein [Candidatus Latescibacterota bacterium]